MAHLKLQLLGGFSVRPGSGAALSMGTKKAQALIAYLAVPPGRPHPRDKLANLLWGDTGDEQARQSLRQTLATLRRALVETRPPVFVVDRDTLALDPDAVEVDVSDFERLAAGTTAKALEQAAELYKGDLLEGVRITEDSFEDWLRTERARLRQLVLDALTRLLTLQTKANETERSVHTAARLLALDPVQEGVHRTLMRLYARHGRRAEALRQYQVCVGVLQRELRAEPEAETKHLYRELLRQTSPRDSVVETSPSRTPTPAPDAIQGAPSLEGRLIGREAEMAHMRRAWATAGQGRGQVVVIVGEAGIGKSRLLAEVAAEASQRSWRIVLGRCYETEQILPFGPWVDALRAGTVIGDEALLEKLNPTRRAELGRLVPEVAASGGPVPTGDRLLLFESVVHVIEQLAAAQPIMLGLEDLHWADELSLRLLAFMARRIRAAAILIVATVRGDEPGTGEALRITRDELGREPHCSSLPLAPLSRADTAALVHTLEQKQEDDAIAPSRADRVWAISEGNPFIAIETIRALQEGSMPAAPTPGRFLPPRIVEIIGRRLERLSLPAQELAAVAAVVGREFEFTLLQRASGIAEREAAVGVEELVRRRVLHGVGEHFDFTHDRIREAIATSLLAPRKKVLHGQVAAAIEEIYPSGLELHATALGLHFLHAQAWDKASAYLFLAGTAALSRSANREAVVCLEQALGALEHLAKTRDMSERAIDIRLELHHALYSLGNRDLDLGHLREAERLAVELADQGRLGRVLAAVTNQWWFLGEYDLAVTTGERAVAIGLTLGDLRMATEARSSMSRAHHSLGNFCRAKALYRDILDELRADPRQPLGVQYVFLSFRLAQTLAELGEFSEGLALAGEAIEIYHATANWYGLAHALFGIGFVHLGRGDLPAAIVALEQAVAFAKSRDFPVQALLSAAPLGYAYALSGRLAEGLPLLEQSVEGGARIGMGWSQSQWSTWWAEALLLAGSADEATGVGKRALDLAVQRNERGQEAYARRLLGEIGYHGNARDPAAAERQYLQAAALAQELGMRPLLAHCNLGLGKLLWSAGQRTEAARDHLATAVSMYREMVMPFWLEQALAALKE